MLFVVSNISYAKLRGMIFNGKIPLLTEFGLVVLLAWIVSGWLLPGEKTEPSGLMRESAGSAAALPDLTGLLAVPLFGESPAQIQSAGPVVKKAAPIVRSPLMLKLLGTVVAGEESAAIISLTAGSDQRVFLIGETIQPGVTLHAVEPWAIVVDRAGILERVSLEQGAELTAASMPVKAAAGFPEAASPVAVQRRMNRGRVQQQLGDFPTLLSQARVIPNFTDGKPDGFVISEIVQGSLYQQAGLLNGDIILKINGQQVTDARQAMSMFQELQNASAIDLELRRAGQVKRVHYDIR